MKKVAFLLLITSVFMLSACEYEIIDSKPGESISPVTNLSHSVSEDEVMLTWDLPSSYPDDIVQPVSVMIRITRDGNNAGTVVLDDAPESYTYDAYDPSQTFKFTVKVRGEVDTDDPNVSDVRYSLGTTVEF
jgi:hypothetical protein